MGREGNRRKRKGHKTQITENSDTKHKPTDVLSSLEPEGRNIPTDTAQKILAQSTLTTYRAEQPTSAAPPADTNRN